MITQLAETSVAIEAFREAERRRFRADLADLNLTAAVTRLALVGSDDDRAEYAAATDLILTEFDTKRAKAHIT